MSDSGGWDEGGEAIDHAKTSTEDWNEAKLLSNDHRLNGFLDWGLNLDALGRDVLKGLKAFHHGDLFDDRAEVQEQYVEVDGDPRTIGTGKLIYRLGDQKTIDDVMSGVNPYSKQWTHIEIDLVQYVTEALKTAKERGFMTHTDVGDLKLAHFNYGWETPGTYSASLAIKNLRLKATVKK